MLFLSQGSWIGRGVFPRLPLWVNGCHPLISFGFVSRRGFHLSCCSFLAGDRRFKTSELMRSVERSGVVSRFLFFAATEFSSTRVSSEATEPSRIYCSSAFFLGMFCVCHFPALEAPALVFLRQFLRNFFRDGLSVHIRDST